MHVETQHAVAVSGCRAEMQHRDLERLAGLNEPLARETVERKQLINIGFGRRRDRPQVDDGCKLVEFVIRCRRLSNSALKSAN